MTVAACGSSSSSGGTGSTGAGKTIPVTVVADQTGPLALYGSTYLQGVKVGVKQVNDSGQLNGSKLVITSLDSASSATTTATQMQKAVSSDAVTILGLDTSPEALPGAPIAEKAGVPLLADSSAAGLIETGTHVYSMANPYETSASSVAQAVSKVTKKTAIIYANDNEVLTDYYKALSSEFGKLGVSYTAVGASISATDYSAAVTKAMSGNPGAIVVDSGGPMEPNVITALRRAGYKGKLFGDPGSFATVKGVSADANGFQYPVEWIPGSPPNSEAKQFESDFESAYPGQTPLFTAADGYDAVLLLASAIAKSGSTRDQVLTGLQSVAKAGFDGAAGSITFSSPDYRQMQVAWRMAEVQNGKLQTPSS
jgi:branched-chain amino acid transport system substrate-binding protein